MHFCRLYFKPHVKCDSVDNNMAQIFNGSIMEARYLPLVSMLREIFKAIMKRVAQRKSWATKLEDSICHTIILKLENLKDRARYWQASRVENGFYGVEHSTESFVVNLNQGSCSCKG